MTVQEEKKKYLTNKFNSIHWTKKRKLAELARQRENILIIDNGGKIADASRQVINSQVQGCLDGKTSIITKELGEVYIEDVSNRSDLHVWDGDNWTKCDILPSGKKQKCVITMDDGKVIICSPSHKFAVVSNNEEGFCWKECSELSIDDDIISYEQK